MGMVLLKAGSLILIIVLGYVLKKTILKGTGAARVVQKIIMTVTLPAAVITGFSNFTEVGYAAVLILMGLGCNVLMSTIGLLLAWHKGGAQKAFNTLNFSGYSIGAFTMPYIQSIMGNSGIGILCMFDLGNGIMCTGMTYAIASRFSENAQKQTLGDFVKKMFTSVPFCTSILMLFLVITGLRLPDEVYTFIQPLSNANPFLAMFMMGLLFECSLGRKKVKYTVLLLVVRYACSTALAALFYFCLPLPLEVRQITALAVFSPISVMATLFTGNCGGDQTWSGVVNSISIPISVTCITVLMLLMHMGI